MRVTPLSKEKKAPPVWLILVAFLAYAVLYLFLHRSGLLYHWLEDLPIYKLAVGAVLSGADPYAQTYFGLHFVYPPIVLYPASWLARLLPGQSEWILFSCVHVLCMLATPVVLARSYFREAWLTPVFALLVWFAEPDFTGMRALYSANIGPSLYLVLLLAVIPGVRKNRWHWFYAVILIAAAVKVTFLVFLIFPMLAGRKQWLRSIAAAVIVAAVYVAQKLFLPGLYAGYKSALVQQLSVMKMYGYGVFGTAAMVEQKLHPSVNASYAIHMLFAIPLFAILLLLKSRMAKTSIARAELHGGPDVRRGENLWLGVLLMAAIALNPRVLHYDMYLALFAAFVVLAVAWRMTGWKLVALLVGISLPAMIVLPHIRPWLIPQTYSILLVVFALAVGIQQLWRNTQLAALSATKTELLS